MRGAARCVEAIERADARWMASTDPLYVDRMLDASARPPGPWASLLERLPALAQGHLADGLLRSTPDGARRARWRLARCWIAPALLEPGGAVWASIVERPLLRHPWSPAAESVLIHLLDALDARAPTSPSRVRVAFVAALQTWSDRLWLRHAAWAQQLLAARRVVLLLARLPADTLDTAAGPLPSFLAGMEVYLHSTLPSTRYLGMVTAQTVTRLMQSPGGTLDFGVEASAGYRTLDATIRADLAAFATLPEDDAAAFASAAPSAATSPIPLTAPAPAPAVAALSAADLPGPTDPALAEDPDADLVPYPMDDENPEPPPSAQLPPPGSAGGANEMSEDLPPKRAAVRPPAYAKTVDRAGLRRRRILSTGARRWRAPGSLAPSVPGFSETACGAS